MNPSDECPKRSNGIRRLTTAWAVFVVVLMAASRFKADENQRDTKILAAWRDRIAKLETEGAQEFNRLRELLRSRSTSPTSWTQSDLETMLNDGKPFELQPKGKEEVADWTHPDFGIQLYLHFENDVLKGWGLGGASPRMLSKHAKPRRFGIDSRAETIRQIVRPISICVWLTAMITAVVSRKCAWPAAQAMLASALVYGAATVVSPNYNLTFQGVFSNDPMFWALSMYALALVALARTWPSGAAGTRFTTRQLLFVTTWVALLLALGPLGYFALAVFSSGGLLLLFMVFSRQQFAG